MAPGQGSGRNRQHDRAVPGQPDTAPHPPCGCPRDRPARAAGPATSRADARIMSSPRRFCAAMRRVAHLCARFRARGALFFRHFTLYSSDRWRTSVLGVPSLRAPFPCGRSSGSRCPVGRHRRMRKMWGELPGVRMRECATGRRVFRGRTGNRGLRGRRENFRRTSGARVLRAVGGVRSAWGLRGLHKRHHDRETGLSSIWMGQALPTLTMRGRAPAHDLSVRNDPLSPAGSSGMRGGQLSGASGNEPRMRA